VTPPVSRATEARRCSGPQPTTRVPRPTTHDHGPRPTTSRPQPSRAPPPSRAERGQEGRYAAQSRTRRSSRAATLCESLSRSRALPTFACRARARAWAPRCPTADAPQHTSRDVVQERKSGPRRPRAYVRAARRPPSRAEGKSLGATPSNCTRAAAAAVLSRDDVRGRKSKPRAAHPRV